MLYYDSKSIFKEMVFLKVKRIRKIVLKIYKNIETIMTTGKIAIDDIVLRLLTIMTYFKLFASHLSNGYFFAFSFFS